MKRRQIRFFFKRQALAIIQQSEGDPEGSLAYFDGREPRDEEILGLLAISMPLGGNSPFSDWFPSPIEALAALPPSSRAEICELFREQLRRRRGVPVKSPAKNLAAAGGGQFHG